MKKRLMPLCFALLLALPLCSAGEELSDDQILAKLLVEIAKGRTELKKIELKCSPKSIVYLEKRKTPDGQEVEIKQTDFARKEISVKLFNLRDGRTRIVKIKKVGPRLINVSSDFVITIEERPSGITWNGFNTAFVVTGLKGGGPWAVILNNYSVRLKSGKRQDFIYAPHSRTLHKLESLLVDTGRRHLDIDIEEVIGQLKKLSAETGVRLPIMKNEQWLQVATERLILIEQADYVEFKEFLKHPADFSDAVNPFARVKIIVALNGEEAYSKTSSRAKASGLAQFTRRTWEKVVRQNYKWANLPPFEVGVRNHRESIKAEILLHNYNLRKLIRVFGPEIKESKELEAYLAAMYNGGPDPVIQAIKNAATGERGAWRAELRKLKKTNESIEYLEKLDYLLDLD